MQNNTTVQRHQLFGTQLSLLYVLTGINLKNMDFSGSSEVKNPPAKQKTQLQSLVWEDPLEKEMATHSSILAWEIPWTEEPGGLQSMGLQRVRHD